MHMNIRRMVNDRKKSKRSKRGNKVSFKYWQRDGLNAINHSFLFALFIPLGAAKELEPRLIPRVPAERQRQAVLKR